MNRYLLVAMTVALLTPRLHAELAFESTHVTMNLTPDQEQVTAEFKFAVAGGVPIRIKDIETACGCLEAKSDKQLYQPGEKGTVSGLFKIGSMVGEHTKSITIEVDPAAKISTKKGSKKSSGAKPQRLHKLLITLNIPPVYEVKPEVLRWKLGEKPVSKSISFKVLHPDPVKITDGRLTRDNFTYDIETVKEGKEYKIMITPKNTAKPTLGALRLTTDIPLENHRRKMVFFSIRDSIPDAAAGPQKKARAAATAAP